MDVVLLHFEDCPNWRTTHSILGGLIGELGFDLEVRRVESMEEADRLGFRGSPTVLVDGVDPFADPDAPVGFACRVYATPAGLRGSPTEDMLREALSR